MNDIIERLQAGEAITQAEAELVVRATERRCRGQLPFQARQLIDAAFAAGDKTSAAKIDMHNRQSCNYDFNETILAHPFDGQGHRVPCPRCGVIIRFISPVIRLES